MEIKQQIELIFQQLEQMFLQHLLFDCLFSFSWNRMFQFHLLQRSRTFLKIKMILFVNPVPFKLTWTFSPLLDSFIDNSTVAWSDDNKKKRRNQYHCGHCHYAEDQIHEKHSKQQKWLKIKINLEIIRFTKPFLTLIFIVLQAHKSI